MTMTPTEVKAIIQEQLPVLIDDPSVRDFVLRTVSNHYAPKKETESNFERMMSKIDNTLLEIRRTNEEHNRKWDEFTKEQAQKWDEQAQKWNEHNRKWDEFTKEQAQKWDEQAQKWNEHNRKWDEFTKEQAQKWDEQNRKWDEQNRKWNEQNRKWDEFTKEQAQKWDEQNQKWDEQNQKWDEQNRKWNEQHKTNQEILLEIKNMHRKHESTIGALGSRWGLYSEASFRNALKGILEDSFGVQVLNVTEYDNHGEVFGRPDQIELDVIIKNGLLIICEIKSSMSKPDVNTFERKVLFYQKLHNRIVNRKIVISPMVDEKALKLSKELGIEVYSYADDVTV
jgi:hypothetical protein